MDYNTILEYTFANARAKQRNVNMLFPPFADRVQAVKRSGGVRLVDTAQDVMTFDVASASVPNANYTVEVAFLNPIYTLQDLIERDAAVWKSKEELDYYALAYEFIEKVDILWDCTCPSDTYHGFEYIRNDKGALSGREEHRPPKIKNPKTRGFGCKHLALVMNELSGIFLKDVEMFIDEYYSKWIEEAAEKMVAQRAGFKSVADWLKSKEERPKSFARGGEEVKT